MQVRPWHAYPAKTHQRWARAARHTCPDPLTSFRKRLARDLAAGASKQRKIDDGDAEDPQDAKDEIDGEGVVGDGDDEAWISAILKFDEFRGYLVLWERTPAATSWILPAKLLGCVAYVLAFHEGTWENLPEPLRSAAQRIQTPLALQGTELVPDEELRSQQDALVDLMREVTPTVAASFEDGAVPYVALRAAFVRTMEDLARHAKGAITDPMVFLSLSDLVSVDDCAEAPVIGNYFRYVLQPDAPDGWEFPDPCIPAAFGFGEVPTLRDESRLLPPQAKVLFLSCFRAPPVARGFGHWTLLILVWGSVTPWIHAEVYMFDPMGGPVAKEHVALLDGYCAWLGDRGVSLICSEIYRVNTEDLQDHCVTDSGIWILAYARSLLGGEENPIPLQSQIPFLRLLLPAELFLRRRIRRVLEAVPAPPGMTAVLGIPCCADSDEVIHVPRRCSRCH